MGGSSSSWDAIRERHIEFLEQLSSIFSAGGGGGDIIRPILQMIKLSFNEFRKFAQFTESVNHGDSNTSLSDSKTSKTRSI